MNKLHLISLVLLINVCLGVNVPGKLPLGDKHTILVKNSGTKSVLIAYWDFSQRGQFEFGEVLINPTGYSKMSVSKDPNAGRVTGTMGFTSGTDNYILALDDPFLDAVGTGVKGDIMEGDDPELALSILLDSSTKVMPWGIYSFSVVNGVRTTTVEFTAPLPSS